MNEILEMLIDIRPEYDFTSSDNFIEDDYLDSFDIVALVQMFEEKYKITIDALDILPEYFMTIDAMKQLIQKSGGEI